MGKLEIQVKPPTHFLLSTNVGGLLVLLQTCPCWVIVPSPLETIVLLTLELAAVISAEELSLAAPNTGGFAITVKSAVLVAVLPPNSTLTFPVLASLGTLVTIRVAEAESTVAAIVPNLTTLLLSVVLNPVPTMMTLLPSAPEAGFTEVMVGALPTG